MATDGFAGFYVETRNYGADRCVSIQGPVPAAVVAPDADAHHREKYA